MLEADPVWGVIVGSAAGHKPGHTHACFAVEVEFHVEARTRREAEIRVRAFAGQRRLLDSEGEMLDEDPRNLMACFESDLPGIYVHAIRLAGEIMPKALRSFGPLGGDA